MTIEIRLENAWVLRPFWVQKAPGGIWHTGVPYLMPYECSCAPRFRHPSPILNSDPIPNPFNSGEDHNQRRWFRITFFTNCNMVPIIFIWFRFPCLSFSRWSYVEWIITGWKQASALTSSGKHHLPFCGVPRRPCLCSETGWSDWYCRRRNISR